MCSACAGDYENPEMTAPEPEESAAQNREVERETSAVGERQDHPTKANREADPIRTVQAQLREVHGELAGKTAGMNRGPRAYVFCTICERKRDVNHTRIAVCLYPSTDMWSRPVKVGDIYCLFHTVSHNDLEQQKQEA